MSEKLKSTMLHLVDDEKKRIEENMGKYADILASSTTHDGYLLTYIVEGLENVESLGTKRLVDDLCRAGLVSTNTHWTHRNAQLVAKATPLGTEIANALKK